MTNDCHCHERLTRVFRDVFDDDSIEIEDHYTAKDIPGWDSVMHVNLVVTIEEEFDLQLSTREIASIQSVGDVKGLIAARLKAA